MDQPTDRLDKPPGTWYFRATLTRAGVASGPALVSSRRNLTSELEQETGELHYVCAATKELLHFARSSPAGTWKLVGAFGTGPYTGPCMIETLDQTGDELGAGPLELFVEAKPPGRALVYAGPFASTAVRNGPDRELGVESGG